MNLSRITTFYQNKYPSENAIREVDKVYIDRGDSGVDEYANRLTVTIERSS